MLLSTEKLFQYAKKASTGESFNFVRWLANFCPPATEIFDSETEDSYVVFECVSRFEEQIDGRWLTHHKHCGHLWRYEK